MSFFLCTFAHQIKWGAPKNRALLRISAIFLGRAEHIRVLTTKTEFWYMYEDRKRDDSDQNN